MRVRPRRSLARIAAAAVLITVPTAEAEDGPQRNGFDLTGASIPADEILRGGPPRDGIPALSHPPTLPAAEAPWEDDERVIGVEAGGEARAYPLALLVWHELVNDTVGGRPLLVSYCPLCGTGIVFDRSVDGAAREFGVSGLLYRSDLLMYDRETESLWSQISAEAVTGPRRGRRLGLVRSRIARWGDWKREHPATRVLSADTGHRRRYGQTPYAGYETSRTLSFPAPRDPRYHPKMPTVGLRLPGGAARGYPRQEVRAAGGRIRETIGGREVTVRYDEASDTFDVEAPEDVEVIEGYWFAWAAFHPEASVFVATRSR